MTEKRFAELTVKLWRLHQHVNKLRKGTELGVPRAVTVQALKKITPEIREVLRALNPLCVVHRKSPRKNDLTLREARGIHRKLKARGNKETFSQLFEKVA